MVVLGLRIECFFYHHITTPQSRKKAFGEEGLFTNFYVCFNSESYRVFCARASAHYMFCHLYVLTLRISFTLINTKSYNNITAIFRAWGLLPILKSNAKKRTTKNLDKIITKMMKEKHT